MECQTIQSNQIAAFQEHLRLEERVSGTIDKYLRDIRSFAAWLGKRPLDRMEGAASIGGPLPGDRQLQAVGFK